MAIRNTANYYFRMECCCVTCAHCAVNKSDDMYPYPSELAGKAKNCRDAGRLVDEWVSPGINIKRVLSGVEGPIIELAGPTSNGYYHLDGVRLPSKMIITNVAYGTQCCDNPACDLDRLIDHLLDGTCLGATIPECSVGLFAVSNVVRYYNRRNFGSKKPRNNWRQQMAEYARKDHAADVMMNHIVNGRPATQRLLRDSVYLQIAVGVLRTLRPGGIYLTDCTELELSTLRALGFEALAWVNESSILGYAEACYRVVLQKPISR